MCLQSRVPTGSTPHSLLAAGESWQDNPVALASSRLCCRQTSGGAPIVTVADGASHALTFLGGVYGAPVVPLGVDQFGQSGTRADLYRQYGIDADAIVAAAFSALDLVQ
ncbi:MAG: hypothetical protein KatS3mg060_1633 [Dehalococcoidia bacterium]|nr:MAG: hypothetical protein KatS3mg060_1633 [Dehalococcoidia bacterium]